jgi:hypothetical protein
LHTVKRAPSVWPESSSARGMSLPHWKCVKDRKLHKVMTSALSMERWPTCPRSSRFHGYRSSQVTLSSAPQHTMIVTHRFLAARGAAAKTQCLASGKTCLSRLGRWCDRLGLSGSCAASKFKRVGLWCAHVGPGAGQKRGGRQSCKTHVRWFAVGHSANAERQQRTTLVKDESS